MLGWVANVIIIIGMLMLAYRWRVGFLIGAVGSFLWAIKGVILQLPDLVLIEVIIVTVQVFSFWNWGQSNDT